MLPPQGAITTMHGLVCLGEMSLKEAQDGDWLDPSFQSISGARKMPYNLVYDWTMKMQGHAPL